MRTSASEIANIYGQICFTGPNKKIKSSAFKIGMGLCYDDPLSIARIEICPP